jgi:hypothetical protein
MAHFARVTPNEDGTYTVREVIVVADADAPDPFPDGEAQGQAFCAALFGGEWRQTSYNGNFRGMYAGIGYLFDPDRGEHGEFFVPEPPEPADE